MEDPKSPSDDVTDRLKEIFAAYSPQQQISHQPQEILPTPYHASRKPETAESLVKGNAEIESHMRDIFLAYSSDGSRLDRRDFKKIGTECRILDGNFNHNQLCSIFEDYAGGSE
jgi:hypothetical protein